MSIADELREAVRRPGVVCSVKAYLDSIAAEDRAAFEEAMLTRSMPGTIIAAVMRRHGYVAADEQPVNRHRRALRGEDGGCSCQSPTS